ncbi:hypothetical protein [Curtobacterium flaccumfaciens]|uniref:hypothetical protein n=1 Tax=Curtobacterium flaccumfaciens TaxID=2035 RepID=UPI003D9A94FB
MGNLTWPIVVSLGGLLLPVAAGYLQSLNERSSLRQLERLAEISKSAHEEVPNGKVTVALRELQEAHIAELAVGLDRDRKKRLLAQALGYVLFTLAGVFASFFTLAQALNAEEPLRGIGLGVAHTLLVLNGAGAAIAIGFAVGAYGALVPFRGPEIRLPWQKSSDRRAALETKRRQPPPAQDVVEDRQ